MHVQFAQAFRGCFVCGVTCKHLGRRWHIGRVYSLSGKTLIKYWNKAFEFGILAILSRSPAECATQSDVYLCGLCSRFILHAIYVSRWDNPSDSHWFVTQPHNLAFLPTYCYASSCIDHPINIEHEPGALRNSRWMSQWIKQHVHSAYNCIVITGSSEMFACIIPVHRFYNKPTDWSTSPCGFGIYSWIADQRPTTLGSCCACARLRG